MYATCLNPPQLCLRRTAEGNTSYYIVSHFLIVHYLGMNVSEQDQEINSYTLPVRRVVDISHSKISGKGLLFIALVKPRQAEKGKNPVSSYIRLLLI